MDIDNPDNSVESSLLPLFMICNLTKDFKDTTETLEEETFSIKYSLLEIEELPDKKSEQLVQVVNDFDACFKREADVLLKNHCSDSDVESLFLSYKSYLLSYYGSRKQYFDNMRNSLILHDSSLVCNSSFESDLSEDNKELFSFDADDFVFINGSVSCSTTLLPEICPHDVKFNHSQLCNGPDSLYPDYMQFHHQDSENMIARPLNEEIFAFKKAQYDSGPMGKENNELTFNRRNSLDSSSDTSESRKRSSLSKENRILLETVFSVKKFPNSTERKLLAKKCQLSPSQIRVWFTNKRARCKPC